MDLQPSPPTRLTRPQATNRPPDRAEQPGWVLQLDLSAGDRAWWPRRYTAAWLLALGRGARTVSQGRGDPTVVSWVARQRDDRERVLLGGAAWPSRVFRAGRLPAGNGRDAAQREARYKTHGTLSEAKDNAIL